MVSNYRDICNLKIGYKKPVITPKFEKFTNGDLKPGYVVELRNGEFAIIAKVGGDEDAADIIALFKDLDQYDAAHRWRNINTWTDNLSDINECDGFDIVRVYGYVIGPATYGYANDISTDGRPLLWERKGPKKMTVSEISKALGYEVEIVAETMKGD